jgi:hypothetical protein
MNIKIEQLKELQDGKIYYLRLSDGMSQEEVVNFAKNIEDLDLKCMIIVGSGEFDISEVEPKGL